MLLGLLVIGKGIVSMNYRHQSSMTEKSERSDEATNTTFQSKEASTEGSNTEEFSVEMIDKAHVEDVASFSALLHEAKDKKNISKRRVSARR